ncbi:MAG: caspase family protein [Planctomycetes bacterium]|nr:caspase family protein [Planctomycetota bacterium]MBI3845915.1 caspase family protein [Planctomycetota bacterium]
MTTRALFVALALAAAATATADDKSLPKLTGTLCSRVDPDQKPYGPTTRFFADHEFVVCVVHADGPIPAGQKVRPAVVSKEGEVLESADVVEGDGKRTDFVSGVRLAGSRFAQDGGKFDFAFYWGDAEKPALSLPFEVSTANRWALLVGIKDYPPAGPEGDLAGCDLDIKKMKEVLTVAFGMPEDHVVVLADLAATKAAIENELTSMAEKAGPEDAAIFYYSGHGAQVPDLDGDEDDGWDEAIVPADEHPQTFTTEEQMKTLLTDDRIAELLAKFKTPNVTVIFDSCHSGTAVRAASTTSLPRRIVASKKQDLQFSRALVEKGESARKKRGAASNPRGLDVDKRYVLIAGCRPWETSGSNGEVGGFLTAILVNHLIYSEGASWDDIVSNVRESVSTLRPIQCPQVEGATRRFPFSLVEKPADAPYVRPTIAIAGLVAPAGPNDKAPPALGETGNAVTHDAMLAGLSSIYDELQNVPCDVYPAGDLKLEKPPKGRIVLTGKGRDAVVKYGDGSLSQAIPYSVARIEKGPIEMNDRALPLAVRVPGERPRVVVASAGDSDAAASAKLEPVQLKVAQWIASTPELQFVPEFHDLSEFDYALVPMMTGDKVTVVVINNSNSVLASFDPDLNRGAIDFLVTRHSESTRLVRLANPSPAYSLRADLEGDGRYAPGANVKLHVTSNETGFVTVIVVPEKGPATVHPDSGKPIRPNQTLTFEETIPRDATGRTLFKVVLSSKPIDAKALRGATSKAGALIASLQEMYGNAGDPSLVSTNGWAAATLFATVAK